MGPPCDVGGSEVEYIFTSGELRRPAPPRGSSRLCAIAGMEWPGDRVEVSEAERRTR
jgi:hypothetical protein